MRNFISEKIILIMLGILICMILQSCNYRTTQQVEQKDLSEQQLNILELDNNYESVQRLVLSKQCLTCHSSAGGNAGKLNLETYENIKLNLNQIVFRVIEKKDMPQNGLPDSEFQLIKLWLESGAPEKNSPLGGGNAPITGPLDWSKIKNQILVKNCLDCHSGEKPDANLNLENLEIFRLNLTKIIERTLVKQDMPPQPYGALTMNQRQALLKWISQGLSQ